MTAPRAFNIGRAYKSRFRTKIMLAGLLSFGGADRLGRSNATGWFPPSGSPWSKTFKSPSGSPVLASITKRILHRRRRTTDLIIIPTSTLDG